MNPSTAARSLVTALALAVVLLWLWPTAAHAQSTTTIHGTGLQPLVEESGSTQTLNIYGPGGVIIAQVATDSPTGGTPTTQTRYLLHDHLGSTRVVLDSNNQVLGSFDYSPFGETTLTGTVDAVAYRYTGQEVNGALETYNYHARHYDAGVGRFLRVDPARYNSSSYVYANDNPINFVDNSGRFPEWFSRLFRRLFRTRGNRPQIDTGSTNIHLVRQSEGQRVGNLNRPQISTGRFERSYLTVNEKISDFTGKYAVLLIDPHPRMRVNVELMHVLNRAVRDEAPIIATTLGHEIRLPPPLESLSTYINPLQKDNFNAFAGTDLEQHLNALGVRNLILAGHEANCCVLTTAVGGPEASPRAGFSRPHFDGAVQRDFNVFTDRALLNFASPPPNQLSPMWSHEHVKFFTHPQERSLQERTSRPEGRSSVGSGEFEIVD